MQIGETRSWQLQFFQGCDSWVLVRSRLHCCLPSHVIIQIVYFHCARKGRHVARREGVGDSISIVAAVTRQSRRRHGPSHPHSPHPTTAATPRPMQSPSPAVASISNCPVRLPRAPLVVTSRSAPIATNAVPLRRWVESLSLWLISLRRHALPLLTNNNVSKPSPSCHCSS